MNLKKVIVTQLAINSPKQIALFQFKIPREVKNIIGVDSSLHLNLGDLPRTRPTDPWVLPMTIHRNLYVGDLKLQSLDKANIFYQCDISQNNNMDNADFTNRFFVPRVYTHETQYTPESLNLSGSTTILSGFFRDHLSDQLTGNYAYTLSVYIWMELKEKEN